MTKPAIIPFDRHIPLEPWPDFPEADIVSGSRQQKGHMWFADRDVGFSAGMWEAEANESGWMTYPVNEFMLVLEGKVVIIEDHATTTIQAGESFIIPKGTRFRWTQNGRVQKFFVTFDDASGNTAGSPPRVIKIDPQTRLSPSTPPAADMLLSPQPTQHAHEFFSDATGQMSIGVWDTTAYHRKLIDFPRHELMHLLEGSVTMEDDLGRTQTFRAGDTFFVPLGAPNAWKCDGYLRKIFCIFQPNA